MRPFRPYKKAPLMAQRACLGVWLFLLSLGLGLVVSRSEAATYYVSAATGNDSRSCGVAQTLTTPRLTINAGIGCLFPGDTLLVQSGTYVEVLNPDANGLRSGTSGNPITIQSQTRYGAIIRPDASQSGQLFDGVGVVAFRSLGFIVFDGFVLDMVNMTEPFGIYTAYNSHDITIQNNDIKNGHSGTSYANGRVGIVIPEPAYAITVRNNLIHDIGLDCTPLTQLCADGMYIVGDNNLIEGNEIYNIPSQSIQLWDGYPSSNADNNIIRGNLFHHNGARVLMASGTNNQFYNNVVYTNGGSGEPGIVIGRYGNATTSAKVWNNTFYNIPGPCVDVGTSTGTVVQNNVCWQTGSGVQDGGTATVADHNLEGIDPLFVAPGSDFHIQSSSPARDVGLTVTTVATDRDGIARPQGSFYDRGAYEFVSGGGGPPQVGTFYLAPGGSDTISCAAAQAITTPKKTLASVLPCAAGGSTIYLRAGTYAELLDTSLLPIAAGSSWNAPTTIAAYQNETVTLQNPGVAKPIIWLRSASTDHYLIFDKLHLDGNTVAFSNGFATYPGVDHIRFQNGEIKNTYYEAVLLLQSSTIEILNSSLHDTTTFALLAVGGTTGCVIHGNTFFNSPQEGIAPKNGLSNSTLEISGNLVSATGTAGAASALVLKEGTDTLVKTNVLTGNRLGILVQSLSQSARLYNNTITANSTGGIQIDSGATGTIVTNNIVFNTGAGLVNNGSSTSQTTNLFTDPLFVNGGAADFHLTASSGARGFGLSLPGVLVTDFDGIAVPQSGAIDVGALQFVAGSALNIPPPLNFRLGP